MGLALGQFQQDRATNRIDQGMDLCGQATARATDGPREDKMIRGITLPEDGSAPFFWAIGRILVNPDRRGVDYLDIAPVSL